MIYSKKEQLKLINDPHCDEYIHYIQEHKDGLLLTFYFATTNKIFNFATTNKIFNIENPYPEVIRLVKIKEKLKKL